MIRTGIIGAAGYTGGELLRILLYHPEVRIEYAYSKSQAGKSLSSIHQDLFPFRESCFADSFHHHVDVLFLCSGHGESRKFLQENKLPRRIKVIDLSQDFRWSGEEFVYGLPEMQRKRIASAKKVANPGCFATAILLSVLPMAAFQAIEEDIHVHAVTGSTGAGFNPTATTHFSWRSHNISVYKAFNHQHLHEIRNSLAYLQEGFQSHIHFVPMRGNFTRGILASVTVKTNRSEEEIRDIYNGYYKDHPFVHVSEASPHLKMVSGSNFAVVNPSLYNGMLHVVTVIDNLIKGASGQAVQNMNLMYNLAEPIGLPVKALAY